MLRHVAAAMAIVACLAAYPGCSDAPGPPEAMVPVAKFAASYERSGGLAPSAQRLVVRPGRRATATTLGPGGKARSRTARFRLSVLTVKRLRNALSQPPFATYGGAPADHCADCYVYTLEFRGHSVSFPESEIPPWLRRTVRRCEALVEAHLPFH